MRKNFFLLFLLCSIGTHPVQAAETSIPRALPVEKDRKPNLLQRIFGKKPKPVPQPVATPSPTPKPRKKKPRLATNKPKAPAPLADSEKPPGVTPSELPALASRLPDSLPPLADGPTGMPTPEVVPPETIPDPPAVNTSPKPTSVPPTVRESPLNQPIPLIDGASAPVSVSPESSPEAAMEQEAVQRIQFRKIKAKALEDGALLELKQKSEQAASPAQRLIALKEYYPRLFASMRKLDETLSMEIDEMEAASRRRLERMESEDSTPPN